MRFLVEYRIGGTWSAAASAHLLDDARKIKAALSRSSGRDWRVTDTEARS